MTSVVYPLGKKAILDGAVALLTDTIKVALIDTGAYTYSAAHDFYNDLAGVIGTPGTIANKTTTGGVFDGDDVVISAVTGNTIEAVPQIRRARAPLAHAARRGRVCSFCSSPPPPRHPTSPARSPGPRAPTLAPGAVTASPAFVAAAGGALAPALTAGNVGLDVGFVDASGQAFDASVSAGGVAAGPAFVSATGQAYVPSIANTATPTNDAIIIPFVARSGCAFRPRLFTPAPPFIAPVFAPKTVGDLASMHADKRTIARAPGKQRYASMMLAKRLRRR